MQRVYMYTRTQELPVSYHCTLNGKPHTVNLSSTARCIHMKRVNHL